MVAAWYPDGKDDPSLTLLRFDVRDAEVWISKGGAVRLAWEVAKANLTGATPDVGTQKHLDLN
jgi:general stress protein 26